MKPIGTENEERYLAWRSEIIWWCLAGDWGGRE